MKTQQKIRIQKYKGEVNKTSYRVIANLSATWPTLGKKLGFIIQ